MTRRATEGGLESLHNRIMSIIRVPATGFLLFPCTVTCIDLALLTPGPKAAKYSVCRFQLARLIGLNAVSAE